MADVLSRIVGPVAVASGTSTVFTGTAAHVYTVKGLRIVNNSGSAVTIKLGIGGVADANLILPAVIIPAGGVLTDQGMWVFSSTETVQANASSTGLTISLHGLDQS